MLRFPWVRLMPFPTRLRAKISSRLSHPVGAEIISAELLDVPQAASLEISFLSKYERMETKGEPYEILTVLYTPWELHDSGWRIWVRPVPRELKHFVKEALTAEFFPRIRQWLKARTGANSRYSRESCGVIFDERHEPMFKWRDRNRLVKVNASAPLERQRLAGRVRCLAESTSAAPDGEPPQLRAEKRGTGE